MVLIRRRGNKVVGMRHPVADHLHFSLMQLGRYFVEVCRATGCDLSLQHEASDSIFV